jgi:hypothetical protein
LTGHCSSRVAGVKKPFFYHCFPSL